MALYTVPVEIPGAPPEAAFFFVEVESPCPILAMREVSNDFRNPHVNGTRCTVWAAVLHNPTFEEMRDLRSGFDRACYGGRAARRAA